MDETSAIPNPYTARMREPWQRDLIVGMLSDTRRPLPEWAELVAHHYSCSGSLEVTAVIWALLAENGRLRRDLAASEGSEDARLAIAEKALRDIQSMAEQFDTPRDASRVRVFVGDLRHLVSRGLGEYRG